MRLGFGTLLAFVLLLSSCGGENAPGDQQQMDKRYQQCIARGGDFSTNYDNTGFQCVMPDPRVQPNPEPEQPEG